MKINPILITLSDPSSDADGVNEGIRMLMASADSWLRALAARRLRNPADIEDAVQDVYIRVHRSRQTYTGDTEEAARKWLGAIVANCSRDILKPKRVNDLERRKHLHMEFDSYEEAWSRALEDQDTPKLPDYQLTHEVRGPSELQRRSARTARRRRRKMISGQRGLVQGAYRAILEVHGREDASERMLAVARSVRQMSTLSARLGAPRLIPSLLGLTACGIPRKLVVTGGLARL